MFPLELFKLLRREVKAPLKYLVFFTLTAGMSNALLVNVINTAAESILSKSLSQRYFLMFLFCAAFVFYSRKYIFDAGLAIIEDVVNQLRKRIGYKIWHTELSIFEHLGTAPLYACITQDILNVSKVAWDVMASIQAMFITFFMLFYIASLSTSAVFLVLAGILISILNYMVDNAKMSVRFEELSKKEVVFFDKFSSLLFGFKEIKLNEKKGKAVFKNYIKINDEKSRLRVATFQAYNKSLISSQVFLYIMIAAIIFVLPHYDPKYPGVIIKITAAILFIVGPISAMMSAIPNLAITNTSAKNIFALEKKLDQLLDRQKREVGISKTTETNLVFEQNIQLKDVIFKYQLQNGPNPFHIGPINLTINKGELIFITGGNGSGKSTFLKTFTGLYLPTNGTVCVDGNLQNGEAGTMINTANYQAYRNIFSSIFADFHLFEKLHGLDDIDGAEVDKLLREMELPYEKVRYQNGGFSTIKLSSGQKKRLALTAAILEDKDIYIFDEVAADLDPWFRDVYYYKILSKLKAKNKTIFVVSHDREYWHIADRILLMETGQLRELKGKEIESYRLAADEAAKALAVL